MKFWILIISYGISLNVFSFDVQILHTNDVHGLVEHSVFDKKIGGHGWKDLYEKIQKPSFDEPKNNEADYLLIHDKNTEEIILKIKKILK